MGIFELNTSHETYLPLNTVKYIWGLMIRLSAFLKSLLCARNTLLLSSIIYVLPHIVIIIIIVVIFFFYLVVNGVNFIL